MTLADYRNALSEREHIDGERMGGMLPANNSSNVYEASRIIKGGEGVLLGFTVYNSNAAAQFILLFDAAQVPPDGTAPVAVFTVATVANLAVNWIPGRTFRRGIVICNSSTGPTLTIGAADCFFDAQYVQPMPISNGGGGGVQAVRAATATLTDAQVKALQATPIQVLASQGAGTIIVPLHATLRLAWTADYAGIDAAATINIANGTNQSMGVLREDENNSVSALLAGGGPDGSIAWLPFDALAFLPSTPAFQRIFADSGFFDSDIADKPLMLTCANNGSNFTGGNAANTLKVTVVYYVVTF